MVVVFPFQKLRDFPLSHSSPAFKNCMSARCTTAENLVCGDFDVFRKQTITITFDKLLIFVIKFSNNLFR
jgi:hypothetical protein